MSIDVFPSPEEGSRHGKEELLWLCEWTSSRVLEQALVAWIEWYNTRYLHSALGFWKPSHIEQQHLSHSSQFMAA